MAGEEIFASALVEAAGGNFFLLLFAFFVFSIIPIGGTGVYLLVKQQKNHLDENAHYMAELVRGQTNGSKELLEMQNKIVEYSAQSAEAILEKVEGYKTETLLAIKDHDRHAECVKREVLDMKVELKSRPCMNDFRRG